jgi:hypothetical protein
MLFDNLTDGALEERELTEEMAKHGTQFLLRHAEPILDEARLKIEAAHEVNNKSDRRFKSWSLEY